VEAVAGTEAVEFAEDHAPCKVEVAHGVQDFVAGAFVLIT